MEAVDHVVVLMLENRSFDHMLGFLDHPDAAFPRLHEGAGAFSNPANPARPRGDLVPVTRRTEPWIDRDPPHSHGSVMHQLDVSAFGRPRMNGFVSAYHRKLAGAELGLPVVHFGRIAAAGAAVAAAVGVLVAFLGGLGLTGLAVAAAVGVLLDVLIRHVDEELPGEPVRAAVRHGATVVGSLLAWVVGYVAVGLLGTALAVASVPAVAVVVLLVVVRQRRRTLLTPPRMDDPAHVERAGRIMQCLDPDAGDLLPALATLAREFAVCTRWHCSVPGATWPNRMFAHAGSSDGTVDIEVDLYDNDTVFDRLDEAGCSWRVYHDGVPQVMAFSRLWDDPKRARNWYPVTAFEDHVRDLPAYSFIEPRHYGGQTNSQHPGNNEAEAGGGGAGPSDFARADQLIGWVYEALRSHPETFARTVLVVTYDEHGGFFDHVAPPTDAVAPTPIGAVPQQSGLGRLASWFVEQPDAGFDFHILGPRVPTVVVSPLIPAATVDDGLYDHASIPAAVRRRFAPGTAPLSEREEAAADFAHLFSLSEPRTDLPDLGRHAGIAGPGVSGAVSAAPRPVRIGVFGDQLGRLASRVGDRVDARLGADPAGRAPQALPDRGDAPTEQGLDAVARRFSTWAEQARRDRA